MFLRLNFLNSGHVFIFKESDRLPLVETHLAGPCEYPHVQSRAARTIGSSNREYRESANSSHAAAQVKREIKFTNVTS